MLSASGICLFSFATACDDNARNTDTAWYGPPNAENLSLQYSEKSQNLFVVPLSTNLLYGERGGLYSPFDGLLLYLLINKISEELRCDQRTRHFSILICIIFLFNFFSSLLLFLYFINIITTWKINFINIIIEAEICIIIIKRRKEEMMEIKKEKK